MPIEAGAQASSNGNGHTLPDPDEPSQSVAGRAVTPAAKLMGQLVWACAQVMRAHSLTADRRAEETIYEALELWCSKTGGTPEEAVRLEAENFRVYQERARLMTYNWGFRWWFKRGYWSKPDQWPYDQKQLARNREARVGTSRSVFE